MDKYEKLKRLGDKYNINIISEAEGRIIYELNGYVFNIIKEGISRVKLDNPYFMTCPSYIKYLNDTIFKGTNLKVIDLDGDHIIYVNLQTMEHSRAYKYNINIESMINITSKENKYRNAIMEIHGDKYNYDNCWPSSVSDVVELECPIHGKFKAKVSNLLYNHSGCPGCANEAKGYSRHIFINSCVRNNNGNGTLYIAKISNDKEEFIKVGITSYANTDKRFYELKKLYEEVTPILEINSEPSKVYNLEHYLHKHFAKEKYIPLLEFNGRQECYKPDVLEKVIEITCKKL